MSQKTPHICWHIACQQMCGICNCVAVTSTDFLFLIDFFVVVVATRFPKSIRPEQPREADGSCAGASGARASGARHAERIRSCRNCNGSIGRHISCLFIITGRFVAQLLYHVAASCAVVVEAEDGAPLQ